MSKEDIVLMTTLNAFLVCCEMVGLKWEIKHSYKKSSRLKQTVVLLPGKSFRQLDEKDSLTKALTEATIWMMNSYTKLEQFKKLLDEQP